MMYKKNGKWCSDDGHACRVQEPLRQRLYDCVADSKRATAMLLKNGVQVLKARQYVEGDAASVVLTLGRAGVK